MFIRLLALGNHMTGETITIMGLAIVTPYAVGYWLGSRGAKPKSSGIPESSSTPLEPLTDATKTEHPPVIISPPSTISPHFNRASGELFQQVLGALEISTIDIQYTADWDRAMETATENTVRFFITGVAGTVKPTLLKYFVTQTSRRKSLKRRKIIDRQFSIGGMPRWVAL
jgi:hypothetical protein